MFLFIFALQRTGKKYTDLNTSHVLIYPGIPGRLFVVVTFKYISCSYLSRNKDKTDSTGNNLNTSHVLIYHLLVGRYYYVSYDLNTSHVLIYLCTLMPYCGAYFI